MVNVCLPILDVMGVKFVCVAVRCCNRLLVVVRLDLAGFSPGVCAHGFDCFTVFYSKVKVATDNDRMCAE